MRIIYQLSGPIDNSGFPKEIKSYLKEDLKNKKSITFIPTTPDDYQITEMYVNGNCEIIGLVTHLLEIVNITEINILDRRISPEKGKSLIEKSDIVYLLGGNPLNQLKYLKENGYDKCIKNFDGIIIGTSAGAMNLSKISYYSKDKDCDKTFFYEGLALVDLTVDPHFDIDNQEQVEDAIKYSNEHPIIGLPDNSGIRITNQEIIYINQIYSYIGGKITEHKINTFKRN